MAEFVRTKVASGDYASDSEVLRDALRVLRERDRAHRPGYRRKTPTTETTFVFGSSIRHGFGDEQLLRGRYQRYSYSASFRNLSRPGPGCIDDDWSSYAAARGIDPAHLAVCSQDACHRRVWLTLDVSYEK
jgi:hypothetical protein